MKRVVVMTRVTKPELAVLEQRGAEADQEKRGKTKKDERDACDFHQARPLFLLTA